MSTPFVFIDRDDTLIYDIPYLDNPDRVELTPGAGVALKALREAGFRVALVTNQSGVHRGFFTMATLARIHARIQEHLAADGAALDAIYLCPHTPEENCDCRKPKTGLLRQACAEHDVDLRHSVLVGDLPKDMEMGRAFGLRTVQIQLAGRGKVSCGADFEAATLPDALPFLLGILRE